MNIKLMIAVAFSTLVALPLAKAQAAEVIAGKDIIYPGTTAPMSAFMRADEFWMERRVSTLGKSTAARWFEVTTTI